MKLSSRFVSLSKVTDKRHQRKNAARNRRFQMESLEARVVLAADLVISEFQASNDTTIFDEDGESSDWIEIHNRSIEDVNLDGWHLTDDDTDLVKWTFPATTLAPNEYLVVFASGKDRGGAGSQLHTNFRLSSSGEYLGLVDTDGLTIVSEFSPEYPVQVTDQSYGLAVGRESEVLFDGGAVKTLVPTDGSLGTDWTTVDFDDAGWASGTTGVGYEQLASGFTSDEDFADALGPEWTLDAPGDATAMVTGGMLELTAPGGADADADRGTAPIVSTPATDQFSDFEFETKLRITSNSGRAGIVVMDGANNTPAIKLELNRVSSFIGQIQLSSLDNAINTKVEFNVEDIYLRLSRNVLNDSWTGSFKLAEGDDWSELDTAVEGSNGVPQISDAQIGLIARNSGVASSAAFDYANLNVRDENPVYGPFIGTDTEAEMFNQANGIYARIPFNIDGDPARFDELGMSIRYDDGFIAYLNGVQVATGNSPVEFAWDSTANSPFGAVAGNIPVVGVALNGEVDLLRSGENILAIHSMNNAADDKDMFFDVSLNAADVLDVSPQYFTIPTPGAVNELPAATAPIFSVTGGTFVGTQTLEMTTTDMIPTLEFRYTTDGTDPDANSTLYTGPIAITTSMNVRAIAIDSNATPVVSNSNVTSEAYIAVDAALADRDSNMPLMVIDTFGQAFQGAGSTTLTDSITAIFDVDPNTGRAELVGGNLDYSGNAGFRRRGSSTGGNAKPNLVFEVWGGGDDDFDAKILGFAAESDWVLYAPGRFDRALMHEPFIFELSNDIGRWAPETHYVEIYENTDGGVVDQGDYAGVYVLMEKIKQGNNREDVRAADPNAVYDASKDLFEQDEAITGGYIWKIDRADPGEPPFSAGGGSLNWVYPKHPNYTGSAAVVTPDQQAYVTDYFNEFWSVLNDSDTSVAYDPVDGYEKYINVDAWINNHLLNIITMNVDAQRLSTYLHKDAGGKIEMGSIWDFDRAIESTDGRDDDPTEWRGKGGDLGTDFFGESGNGMGGLWWRQLFDDPNFFQRYIDRYVELRQGLFSDAAIDARLDDLKDRIGPAGDRNANETTGGIANEQDPRNGNACHGHAPGETPLCDDTWNGEAENMRSWLHRRLEFIDAQFAPYVTFNVNNSEVDIFPTGVAITAGTEVEMTSPGEGLIYYTTDGTDPRGLDGEPSATAIPYNGFAEVIGEASTGKFFVPTGAADENGWQEVSYDDSSWTTVDTQVGFDEDMNTAELRGQSGFVVRTIDATAFVTSISNATDLLDGTSTAGIDGEEERVDPYLNHSTSASGGDFDSPGNLQPPGLTSSEQGFATRASAAVTIPAGTWTVAVSSDDGMRMTLPGVEFTNRTSHNTSGALAPRVDELMFTSIRTGTTTGTFTLDEPLETVLLLDHFQFFASDNLELSIASGDQAFDPANFTILQDGTMGWDVKAADVTIDRVDFAPSVSSDVASEMFGNNSSAYIRYPFSVNRATDVLDLQANFRYDDGFVAYLNGTEILRFAAPENLTFNSTATEARDNFIAQDEINVSLNDHLDSLVDGENVLAIQVLNVAADDTDLLFSVDVSGKVKGTPIVLNENTRIRARNFDASDRGDQAELVTTDWSAIITHDFIVDSGELAITEINYNPHSATASELASDPTLGRSDFEFIEIQNISDVPASLTGVQLVDGVEFDFASSSVSTLAPGERVLVVGNQSAFELRYGAGLPVAGQFSGSLSNGGERVQLNSGETSLFDVSYDVSDPWSAIADGDGGTIELADPGGVDAVRSGKYYSWQLSADFGGSPGTAGGPQSNVVINEVLTRTDDPAGATDAIELLNTSTTAVDIGGWFLSDAGGNPLKFEIPAGTTLAASGYIVFDESDFNAAGAENGFALDSSEGDEVILSIPNATGDGVASFVDAVEFGAAKDGVTFGRVPNGSGRLAPLATPSLGGANGGADFGPLVITELNYNPGTPSASALAIDPSLDAGDLEFVEIHNSSAAAEDLSNWEIRGGVDFDFDAGTMLAAGEAVVVVAFNPDNPDNANRLSAFRTHYGIGNSVRILGGYGGNLSNGSDRVQLQRPDTPPIDQPGLFPGLYEDEVLYDDLAPWPAADGTGVSLNRTSATSFGNDSSSWVAGAPTPGQVSFGNSPGDLTGDGTVDVQDIDFLCNAISDPFDAMSDLNDDGVVDLSDVEMLVTGFLGTAMGDSNLDGQVNVIDLNRVGINWLQEGGADWSAGDFTCDGNVSTADLNQVGLNWQFGTAPVRAPRAPLAAVLAFPADAAHDQAVQDLANPSAVGFAEFSVENGERLKERKNSTVSARRQRSHREASHQTRPSALPLDVTDVLFADLGEL